MKFTPMPREALYVLIDEGGVELMTSDSLPEIMAKFSRVIQEFARPENHNTVESFLYWKGRMGYAVEMRK